MGFSRQEYWSGLPFLSPGDLSDPRIECTSLMSPALAGRFFTARATREALRNSTRPELRHTWQACGAAENYPHSRVIWRQPATNFTFTLSLRLCNSSHSVDLFIFKYTFIYFNWRLITLQYCIGFAIHQHESAKGIHVFPILKPPTLLPPCIIPLGHLSAPAPSIQYHASNLDWWVISYMILYMFQCHSPKSSHPRPLPQSPKDCSIPLCLFCCLTYRVIVTIFLDSCISNTFLKSNLMMP